MRYLAVSALPEPGFYSEAVSTKKLHKSVLLTAHIVKHAAMLKTTAAGKIDQAAVKKWPPNGPHNNNKQCPISA